MRLKNYASKFAVLSVLTAIAFADDGNWRVRILLEPSFPTGVSAILHSELLYPSADDTTFSQTGLEVTVQPTRSTTERPSHVILNLRAFGFRDVTLNTGILNYIDGVAHSVLMVKAEPIAVPKLLNVIRLEKSGKEAAALELSFENPMGVGVDLTKMTLHAVRNAPMACQGSATIYDIKLRLEGEKVLGAGKQQHDNFQYPITGQMQRYCEDYFLTADMPFNSSLGANSATSMKVRIFEDEKLEVADVSGMIYFLRPNKVPELINEARKNPGKPVSQSLVNDGLRWEFEFTINNELTLLAREKDYPSTEIQKVVGKQQPHARLSLQDTLELGELWTKAESGDVESQRHLAELYAEGLGGMQGNVEAFYWYRRAAEKEDRNDETRLAIMYERGILTKQDPAQAMFWFRKAAEKGEPLAQLSVAMSYLVGDNGAEPDYKEASNWLRKAAEQGQVHAQGILGWLYENGKGVPRDEVTAARWYKKAAEQDDQESKKSLERLAKKGIRP